MDATEFEGLAEKTLENLFDAIDDAIGDSADVDFENGILSIELEDGRQYVINKHAPNMQIWLSSPISGAAHYKYDVDTKAWVSTRSDDELLKILSAELGSLSGTTVSLV